MSISERTSGRSDACCSSCSRGGARSRARPCPTWWRRSLEHEPDWQALPPKTPARLRDLLRQCLQKDANCRPNDMASVRAILQQVRSAGRRRAPRIRALAVLPLANLSRDPEQDYFVDGMTEALIAELAQVGALRVISRTSAMHYKGTTKTAPEIARELGVDGIVEGSVMRAGERVRITAQLIDAATDRHLWARAYERDLRDVLHLQGEVARAIADEIQVTLTPQEQARLARTRPVNVEAHEAYIRGRYEWGRAQVDRSIEHFERAIAIDPDYALAYAGIADALCRKFGAAVELAPPTQVAPLARDAALRALALDESLSEPHISLSRVLLWYDRDPVGAEREVRRAIQLNPNSAVAHFISGLLFADLGRGDEAVAALRRSLRLDPVSAWNSAIAGFFLCEIDEREAGRRQLRKAIELEPSFFLPWSLSSVIDCYEGKFPDALAAAEEGVRLSAGLPMARAYAGLRPCDGRPSGRGARRSRPTGGSVARTLRSGHRTGLVPRGPRRLRADAGMAGGRLRATGQPSAPRPAHARLLAAASRPPIPRPPAPPGSPAVAVGLFVFVAEDAFRLGGDDRPQARAVRKDQRRHQSPQFSGIVVDDQSHADRAEETP